MKREFSRTKYSNVRWRFAFEKLKRKKRNTALRYGSIESNFFNFWGGIRVGREIRFSRNPFLRVVLGNLFYSVHRAIPEGIRYELWCGSVNACAQSRRHARAAWIETWWKKQWRGFRYQFGRPSDLTPFVRKTPLQARASRLLTRRQNTLAV